MNPEYIIGQSGRIKAAGATLDVVFDAAREFTSIPTPQEAYTTTNAFAQLRKAPPDLIRDRFFPRSTEHKGQFRNGALLFRPVLKTDQGAGQFLNFGVGGVVESLRVSIQKATGFMIPETFFAAELERTSYPPAVLQNIAELGKEFNKLDIHAAQLAYERLQIACEQVGIRHSREAQVGREAFFFIRPALAQEPVLLPEKVFRNVQKALAQQHGFFEEYAQDERKQFAKQHGITLRSGKIHMPIYFQADIQILPSGDVIVDQIQLPDVGLFLKSIDPLQNKGVHQVKQGIVPLVDKVANAITKEVKEDLGKSSVYLITRKEVVHGQEDILETREIQVLQQELNNRGIGVKVITLSEALCLDKHDCALLLNINQQDPDFNRLLVKQLTEDRSVIFPDPFLLLAQSKMTGYKRKEISAGEVQVLRSIVSVGVNKPEEIFNQLLALDNYLYRLGLEDDVFHMYISSQHTPVPCFRYDPRGFQIALNYVKPGDQVVIRSVPINPQQAILFDEQSRPLYSVFRFIVTKGGL